MGLDQYLIGRRFFWFDDNKKGKAKNIRKLFPEMKDCKLDYVTFEVGYWRKANAIHSWFVENVQNQNDDCGSYDVDREQLKQLKQLCQKTLKLIKSCPKKKLKIPTGKQDLSCYTRTVYDIDKIKEKIELSTKDGFFFGSTEYDDGYFDDLKDTIAIINRCLKLPKEWEFQYSSSW